MGQNICIIPARGGSKRIPGKNIRNFRGRPMLDWSVSVARASGLFDTVMVSTDDENVARIAIEAGAEVPFMRSPVTADDFATTTDVITEVLEQFSKINRYYEFACCLYPTAPFVLTADLAQGLELLVKTNFDVIMPVAAFSYPIWRSLKRRDDGQVRLNFPENLNVRSQDLPQAFHDAGQWYWFKTDRFKETGVLIGSKTGSVVLPQFRVQDIDTVEDWALAEEKHKRLFT